MVSKIYYSPFLLSPVLLYCNWNKGFESKSQKDWLVIPITTRKPSLQFQYKEILVNHKHIVIFSSLPSPNSIDRFIPSGSASHVFGRYGKTATTSSSSSTLDIPQW